MEGTIQDQKIKLIQWLSTLEDAGTIEILMQLRDADKTDWWSTISEAERHSIEKGITDAVEFGKKMKLDMVIVGGYDAYKVGALLKQNNIPVILNGVHSRPNSDDDDYDLPYKAAKLLVDQGVLVGLQSESRNERINTRNIPFYAGTCVAYGLDKEEALNLLTSNTAQILGIDDFCGTLEVGKDATLFISEGDALDMRTNILTHAFIQGREISLETHQTELAKRYSDKYKNQ